MELQGHKSASSRMPSTDEIEEKRSLQKRLTGLQRNRRCSARPTYTNRNGAACLCDLEKLRLNSIAKADSKRQLFQACTAYIALRCVHHSNASACLFLITFPSTLFPCVVIATLSDIMVADKEQCKDMFNLYDEEGDGKIDGTQIGSVVRALGLKPTNAMVHKAAGEEYKRKGEKRITFEEFMPIYEQLTKEKEVGSYHDYLEGLRVFDKEENGKILAAELRHSLLALGERMNSEEVDEMFEGNQDAEGMINYEAFIKKVLAGPFPEEED
ncbi:hypothetical protein M514_05662 [Trichuris suis]|uniref:EF-hand domain-containing protein n=1 Tax=Trichuris suis TaxID=68888 RepID=A0A085MXL5_9BILA|nr:hypothetical protein M514_05662 [Trichuris suis]